MPTDSVEVELSARIPAEMKEHAEFIAARIGEPLDAVVTKALATYLYGRGIYFNALTAFATEEIERVPGPSTPTPGAAGQS